MSSAFPSPFLPQTSPNPYPTPFQSLSNPQTTTPLNTPLPPKPIKPPKTPQNKKNTTDIKRAQRLADKFVFYYGLSAIGITTWARTPYSTDFLLGQNRPRKARARRLPLPPLRRFPSHLLRLALRTALSLLPSLL